MINDDDVPEFDLFCKFLAEKHPEVGNEDAMFDAYESGAFDDQFEEWLGVDE